MLSRREFLGLIGISALSRPLGSKLVLRSGQSDLLADSPGRAGNSTKTALGKAVWVRLFR